MQDLEQRAPEIYAMLSRYFGLLDENAILRAENERLRAALEKYADPENWGDYNVGDGLDEREVQAFLEDYPDPMHIAREALRAGGQ